MTIAALTDTVIDHGRYEFSVNGTTIRFRNVMGGTTMDLQATDLTPTSATSLEILRSSSTRTRPSWTTWC